MRRKWKNHSMEPLWCVVGPRAPLDLGSRYPAHSSGFDGCATAC